MTPVDLKMQMCCLKHEIRCALWEKYARKVVGSGRRIRRYLTLLSPAMMDVKHFHERGLIQYADGVYEGVAGIIDDPGEYARAITTGAGRPQLLVQADLNELIVQPSRYPKDRRAFLGMFPFDVINLDYCNCLFWKRNRRDVSLHIRALERIIDRQRRTGCQRFAIFVTTLAEPEQVAEHFLCNLAERIDWNLRHNPPFATCFQRLFQSNAASGLRQQSHQEFMPVGVLKFLADLVSSVGFEVMDCETAYLFRTSGHWILHVALLAKLPGNVSLRSIGRQAHLERNITNYLHRCIDRDLLELDERKDVPRLQRKHKKQVAKLAAIGFELPVPEPEQ